MHAWQAVAEGDPKDVFQLVEVPAPLCGPGQVRLMVESCGLNYPDLLMVQGKYQVHPTIPFTPGSEICGRVVDGDGANVGERVLAMPPRPNGGLAEEVVVPHQMVRSIPQSISSDDAACLQVTYPTAHIALHHRGGLRTGESVLVHAGAGGVGSAAIQLARANGCRVFATAGGPEKTAVCRALGVHVAIDYNNEDFVEVVLTETHGKGIDIVVDPVGGDVFERSRRCVASEGRIMVVGFTSGVIAQMSTNHPLLKNYAVVGVNLGHLQRANPELMNTVHADLMQLYEAGLIRPLIRSVVDFAEARSALVALSERRTVGKTVVRVSGLVATSPSGHAT